MKGCTMHVLFDGFECENSALLFCNRPDTTVWLVEVGFGKHTGIILIDDVTTVQVDVVLQKLIIELIDT